MPVLPVKQATSVVTSDTPFILPSQPATGTSALQPTGSVSQVTASQTQSFTGNSEMPLLQYCQ